MYKPERANESVFRYQLIAFLDDVTKLHITVKRRFALKDGYSYEQMLEATKKVISSEMPFEVVRGQKGTYGEGQDYYEVVSPELTELRQKLIEQFGENITTRDSHYEMPDLPFHISIETADKLAVVSRKERWVIDRLWLQEGARGKVNSITKCFKLNV